ncbi:MAG: ASCH domain-containing protein [Ectothiorhodospiraceae bacterium]|nr:ASCH domain-containing protein [Ectothiorhodospiraceae bacterium]
MRALSIRQPWAWHILHSGKDIENRDWATKYRGRVLIHASKAMTRAEYEDASLMAPLPRMEDLERGGIVGSVEIVDCGTASSSRWFTGRCGFVLRDPQPVPFIPWKGQLGFFEVPDSVLDGRAEA